MQYIVVQYNDLIDVITIFCVVTFYCYLEALNFMDSSHLIKVKEICEY